MATLSLDYPLDDVRVLVKAAFELTDGIETYHDAGVQIVGKTSGGFFSYGESVTVEIADRQSSEGQTHIAVQADRDVDINITATPERYKQRFLSNLNALRGSTIEDVLDRMDTHLRTHQTKEVTSESNQASGMGKLAIVFVLIGVFTIFTLLMTLLPLLLL